MADITLPVSLQYAVGAEISKAHFASAAIPAGRAVYRNSIRKLAQSRANALATAELFGITVNEADAADQQQYVLTKGILSNLGSILTVGELYFVSNLAVGLLQPQGDIAITDYVTFAGIGLTATQLLFDPFALGVQADTPPTGNFPITSTAVALNGAKIQYGVSGEAFGPNRALYLNSSNQLQLAVGDSLQHAQVVGISMAEAGGAGVLVPYMEEGTLDGVSGVTVGGIYVLHNATPGNLMAMSSLSTGEYSSVVAFGLTTSRIQIKITNSGVAHA